MKKRKSFGITLVVIFLILIGAGAYYFYLMPVKYIGIDINPSIQLSINRLDRVIDAIPLNEEADVLLSDLDLANMTVNDATQTIIDSAKDVGYIDELAEDNAIVIGVSGSDEGTTTTLEEDIKDTVETYLDDNNISALVLTENKNTERKVLADGYGISYGKMLLIQKAVTLDPTLDESTLADETVQSIAKRIKAARVEIKVARQEAKKQEFIQAKKQIRNMYKERNQNEVQQILDQNDAIDDTLSNTEKTKIKNEMIATRKEEIKATVDQAQGQLEDDWSDTTSNNQNGVDPDIKAKVDSIKGQWRANAKK